ncbi:MAG: FAD-dependent thymidylate synthase [Candidatus Pacebacteria bacterium]|nr:FAD-dependent thymidylate synthase [Candidatus Paceibacterota bacterium]
MSKEISNLKHAAAIIKDRKEKIGEVIVLNTGSVITSEATAMLQALHSRSVGGLKEHLKNLAKSGSDKFMSSFYVGYGHKSIGDCGSTVIFIEGVSMLNAKAIQDWKLYSGQEASTRYIDFKEQPFLNPLKTKKVEKVLEDWRKFYIYAMPRVVESLKDRFPISAGEKDGIYTKAIDARAFDILRGFLPAGATTNLAWSTNLRQAADKIALLRHHPLLEVSATAESLADVLKMAHPSSFGHNVYAETEEYNDNWMSNNYYYHNKNSPNFKLKRNSIDIKQLKEYKNILKSRPNAHTELPPHIAELGDLQFEFTLDFGSFRDIQRHRAVTQRMPLLTTDLGFEDWYLDELPKDIKVKAKKLLEKQEKAIKSFNTSSEIAQYYIAMGYKCANRLTGDLKALVYLVELRNTRFVHPTLRRRAIQLAKVLEDKFSKYGLEIFLDKEPDMFDVKRGEHDIVNKDK